MRFFPHFSSNKNFSFKVRNKQMAQMTQEEVMKIIESKIKLCICSGCPLEPKEPKYICAETQQTLRGILSLFRYTEGRLEDKIC